jgi:hypothetical protein
VLGPGGSQIEAAYRLKAGLAGGMYRCVLDCFVTGGKIEVKFELIHRRGSVNTPLAMWTDHFVTGADTMKAQARVYNQPAPPIDFVDGDLFVFRYSSIPTDPTVPTDPTPTDPTGAYTPNGDGDIANREDGSPSERPHIILPL